MANPYFRNLPEFEYVNRTERGRSEGDYSIVKNFFKRGKLREDIFQDLTFFTKYIVEGDDRPDNVADKVYNDPTLDWVVLLSNNITNVQSEGPLSQADFNTYITEKYDDEYLSLDDDMKNVAKKYFYSNKNEVDYSLIEYKVY